MVVAAAVRDEKSASEEEEEDPDVADEEDEEEEETEEEEEEEKGWRVGRENTWKRERENGNEITLSTREGEKEVVAVVAAKKCIGTWRKNAAQGGRKSPF